ncbi:hypothetical protein GALMADRAFT_244947 [Galerina marginata CBS 339.88]|uniref:Ubiquitin-like domain-containing protein n=1 Tax=Galerina marginata (strain CBS 339.88) TaxID=685588 RepID=A0A067TGB1_GALM3|nr:hypothetical protein GALMADRAFT_244947 [Galerina marginata CBS 339.88]
MTVFAFTAGSLADILATAGLVAQVVKVLYDNKHLGEECEALRIELQSLQSVLIMVEFILQRYDSTPLGEPLAHLIRPEVVQCHLLLKAFSNKVNACHQALSSTTIGSLWRKVVWAASDEASSLSSKLSNHRLKLVTLLLTLNSVVWMDCGLNEGQSFIRNGTHSIRSIKDHTIDVVDPLGETLPVPTLFCVTWEAFDHILKGFSKNRIGQRYVEQGDYQIVRPRNNNVIGHSDICKVKDGETIEMSIILRSKENTEETPGICPRCSHLNAHASMTFWTKCHRCSGLFHINIVSTDQQTLDDGNPSDSSDLSAEIDNENAMPNPETSQDDTDTKYFRRITLEIQSGSLKDMTQESNINNELMQIPWSTFNRLKLDLDCGHKDFGTLTMREKVLIRNRWHKLPSTDPSISLDDTIEGLGKMLSSQTGMPVKNGRVMNLLLKNLAQLVQKGMVTRDQILQIRAFADRQKGQDTGVPPII